MAEGETLTRPLREPNSDADQAIQILEVTSHEIIALKPAGLASELPRDLAADSFVRRLEAQGLSGLRLVHRLDAPTCGLMLVARSAEAAAHYSQEIAARRWHKWYVAQVALPISKAEQLVGAHKSYLRVDGSSARVVRAGDGRFISSTRSSRRGRFRPSNRASGWHHPIPTGCGGACFVPCCGRSSERAFHLPCRGAAQAVTFRISIRSCAELPTVPGGAIGYWKTPVASG